MAHVSLRIYDVAGRLVRTLVDERRVAGHKIETVWDGLDDARQRVSTGVYFYRLETPGFVDQRKVLLLK